MKTLIRTLTATTLMLGLVACGSTGTASSSVEVIENTTGIYSTTVTTESGTTVECVYIILDKPTTRGEGAGISCNWEGAETASSE